MDIIVHSQISDIPSNQWNALLKDNNPFVRHEFLFGLEQTGCVSEELGWQAKHFVAYADTKKSKILGIMPCYAKTHSYGEYIFDWAWADAHQRHGVDYYPKLVNAVPFTPATGDRILCSDEGQAGIQEALIEAAVQHCDENDFSSFHALFIPEAQLSSYESTCSIRHSTQFHWSNQGYRSFDDFLDQLSSKKRKNIRRERRRVAEMEIDYKWISGADLDQQAVIDMYRFYQRTIHYYGAQSYLNEAFFVHLAEHFNQQTLFLFAEHEGVRIAGGLYFRSNDTLYGRYWGALANFHSVHFETCYYQAIQWCIENGYQRFEAGAQGEHKLARGLVPNSTWSAHWIRHPEFRTAIDNYLKQEQQHVESYKDHLLDRSPFKAEI